MVDYVKRLRAPALAAVLAVISIFVVLSIGHFVLLLNDGLAPARAAQTAGSASPSLIWVFAAVGLALACVLVRPAVAAGQRLISVAAIIVGGATLVAFAFWVIGLFAGLTLGLTLGALGGLVETIFKAACAVVLWRLRGLGTEEQQRIESATSATGQGDQLPVWDPKQAIGLQWSRAGDAATGGPASGAAPTSAIGRAPEPAPTPVPERRQLWSRGGIAPEQLPQLPWTTAAQAADGHPAGPSQDTPESRDRPRRQAPDWAPAPRPQE